MFTKKLFKLSALLVVLTLVLSVSAFAQIYVSVTQGDDTFGDGSSLTPYSSIGKAISVAATGSTIMVEAGTYNSSTVKPTQTAGTGEDVLAVTGSKSLTFVAYARGIDVIVVVSNGIDINTTGSVSMGLSGEMFMLGSSANALKLTKGTMNIASAKVVIGSGATLTVTDGTLNAVPTTGANLNVTFNGTTALSSTSAFLPSALGTGVVTISKATGALIIDNASLAAASIAITNTTAVTINSNVTTTGAISVAGGTAAVIFNGSVACKGNLTNNAAAALTLNGNVTMGTATAATATDIINANTGTITVGATTANTLTMYSTVDAGTLATDANIGEIKNTNTGSITVNAAITENIKNTSEDGATLDLGAQVIVSPVIVNSGAATGAVITVNGNVTFKNTNVLESTTPAVNQTSHTVTISNTTVGTVALNGSILTPASTAAFTTPPWINVVLSNSGGGTLTTRAAALRGTAGTVGVTNGASGTMTLGQTGDAFTANWDITNAGTKLTLNGTGALGGALTNNAASLVELGASQTISGLVTNNGNMKVNANTLTLTRTAAAALTGAAGGDIFSTTTGSTGSGLVKFTGAAGSSTYAGKLPNVEITSGTSFSLAGNTIWGNLVTSGAGAVTVVGSSAIKGSFNLTGAATVTIDGATTVSGDVNMTAGNITMGTAGLTVSGTFVMPQGTFTFGANTLTLMGNFNRTGGTINAAAAGSGKLYFNGAKPQSFVSGVQMNVYNVEINNTGVFLAGVVEDQNIVTIDGSLLVLNDFTITKGLVQLGTNNIRMEQSGTSARFTNNDRGYTATGIGGIIFEGSGALGGVGTGSVITGTKPFSNLYVRLTTATNNVYCLGNVIISGVVTLDAGGIIWNRADNGADLFSSSTLTLDQSLTGTAYPTVVINTSNSAHGSPFLVDGADLGAVSLAITTLYNLNYTGSTAATMSATDFVTTKVNNLSLIAGTGKTITGTGAAMAIAGNLTVQALETFDLSAQIFTMSGNTAAHVVNGTVTNGTLAVTGNAASLTGSGTGACAVAAGATLAVTSTSGSFTSTGMKVLGNVTITGATLTSSITMNSASASIPGSFTNTSGTTSLSMNSTASSIGGNFTVTDGAVTLTMNGAAAATRTITGALAVNGGTLTLGSAIDVTGGASQAATGSIALGNNNLSLAGTYGHAGTGTITAGTGAVVANIAAAATINIYTLTTTVEIPNLTVNAAGAGSGIQLATSGLTVTNALVHTAGDIDLNSLPLTISGNTFTFTAGTYSNTGAASTGVVNLTGSALVIGGNGSPAIPYVTMNTAGTEGSVTINPTNATPPVARTLTISQSFTQTKGALNLGINDIAFTGGTGYAYTAGTITAATSSSVTGAIGELVFNGATGFTPGALKSLTIPNLTITGGTTVAGTDTFYVANRLTFGDGALTCAVGRMIIKNGAAIYRVNVNTLSALPQFEGVVDVVYMTLGTTTDVELPTSATALRDLTVNVATTLNAAATVNGTLTLGAPLTTTATKKVNLAVGSTVAVNAGGSIATPVAPAGAYKLIYTSNAGVVTTVNEWPVAASVSDLTVAMSAGATLNLNASRTVNNFTLNCGTGGGSFDLSNGGTAYTLTVTGLTTITSGTLMTTTTGGILVVQGDVNAAGGAFGTTVQMSFTGSANQTITTPTGGATIGNITVNKASGSNLVTIAGGDLTCNQVVTFNNGLIVTGASNALVLTNSGGAGTGKGYVRTIAAGGKSHVVGNVKQNLQYATLIAYARNEFPVGDTANYRPAALTFVNSTGSGLFGIFATVSHTNTRPTGTAGLPIVNGIVDGVPLAKYPSFFWSIKTDGPMGATAFNLDLSAAGFDPNELDLNDLGMNRVKIIRRSGVATDVQNQWNLQGARDSYDNVVSAGVPNVTAINATGGLNAAGAIFTYGTKSNLNVLQLISDKTGLSAGADTVTIDLTSPKIFGGNTGVLTYEVTSSNTTVAKVVTSVNPVKIAALSAGSAVITVKAVDTDGAFISTPFNVTVVASAMNVSGLVAYGSTAANAIGAVTVTLTPTAGSALTATSSATGTYTIANVPGGTYTLTASKTGNWGGVTGGDALVVARHAAGIALLSGLPLAAADVNNSGSVTGGDALLIVRRAAGLDASFTGGDWVFASQSVTVAGANVTANISGLAVGDVNASYVPATGTVFAKTASMSLKGMDKFGISFPSSTTLGSVTMRIKAANIANITSKLPGFVSRVDEFGATLVWFAQDGKTAVKLAANEPIATVTLSEKANGSIEVESELTDISGAAVSNELAVAIKEIPTVFELGQNYPNPFNPSTQISYNLPQSGMVTLTVYNVMGQEVAKLVNEQKSAGSYSVEWTPRNLASGMYIYRINVQTENEQLTSSKRLVLLK